MVLITGATGFLGAHLACLLLKKGQIVRALRRSTSSMDLFNLIYEYHFGQKPSKNDGLEWVEGDILDIPSLERAIVGVDKLYHCAAQVSFNKKDRKSLMKVNVEGTANVVNVALSSNISKLCYASSTAAIGRSPENKHITEESDWTDSKLNTRYAISKYHAEMEVWRGIEEGLNAVIINPSVIVGISDGKNGAAKIFGNIKKGMKLYTEGVNGFVDVEDVSNCMINLMESDIQSEKFLCVGDNWSFKKLFSEVAKNFDMKAPSVNVKRWMGEIGWRLAGILAFITGNEPFVTRESARSSQNEFYYSSNKIINALNFQFTPLDKTVEKTCNHLKKLP
jgi:dihydroflavonol-4-reductase